MQRVNDHYDILHAKEMDDNGEPLPERVTGFDLIPYYEHEYLLALRIRATFGGDVEEIVGLRASEFLRRCAMVKAASWSQPTTDAMIEKRERRMAGLHG